ncbi:MAG: thermonuclease family protein [Pseudomonadota bacterium]
MGTRILVILIVLLSAATGYMFWAEQNKHGTVTSVPDTANTGPAKSPLTTVIAVEPVKKDVRPIEKERFAAPNLNEETIARLPDQKPDPVALPKNKVKRDVRLPRPIVVSAGHFRAMGKDFRIAGVIAPDPDETCGPDGNQFPCGRMARTALRSLLRGRTLACRIVPNDDEANKTEEQTSGSGQLADCALGKRDIAEWLVKQGWAKPVAGTSYLKALEEAKEKKRGMWRD